MRNMHALSPPAWPSVYGHPASKLCSCADNALREEIRKLLMQFAPLLSILTGHRSVSVCRVCLQVKYSQSHSWTTKNLCVQQGRFWLWVGQRCTCTDLITCVGGEQYHMFYNWRFCVRSLKLSVSYITLTTSLILLKLQYYKERSPSAWKFTR